MNERRRPPRRGRGPRQAQPRPTLEANDMEVNPYRDDASTPPDGGAPERDNGTPAPGAPSTTPSSENVTPPGGTPPARHPGHPQHQGGRDRFGQNGRRGRRGRGRSGPRPEHGGGAPVPAVIVAEGDTEGWFDASRDGGFIRRAAESYLPSASDAFVPPHIVRQSGLRRGDHVQATVGRDHRGRMSVAEVRTVNGEDAASALRRPEFSSLVASYPERKLVLETGRPAKGGPELTRRAIDLIAPIGFGQRALIVAPARAGKTMLLQAITEGVAINHPTATLLVLLVDERPEEVSEMIEWGRGEVIASSFDQPAGRHG